MVIWENANVRVENKKGEWNIHYKIVKVSYTNETLKQALSDIRFEIHLEGIGFFTQ